jgi:hypothetical protein
MNNSDSDKDILQKYRKFVLNLIDIIDMNYANLIDKEKLTQELFNAIEQDTLDLKCVEDWVTEAPVWRFTVSKTCL